MQVELIQIDLQMYFIKRDLVQIRSHTDIFPELSLCLLILGVYLCDALFLCVSLYVSLNLCVSLCISICVTGFSLCLCMSLCFSVCLFMSLYVSLGFFEFLCLSLYLSGSLCVSLYIFVYLVSLRDTVFRCVSLRKLRLRPRCR
jgi:hypothetical protein